MTAETLTLRRLNRATLSRQMLLERERATPVEAIERLGGLQAQEAKHPFAGLWTRVEGFEREELHAALHARDVLRASWLRATLHLVSASDYAAGRAGLQPVMNVAMGALRGRDEGLDVPKVVAAARTLLAEEQRNFTELRDLLLERFPKVNERALGYATRMNLPLVMVPTDAPWAFPAQADFTLADVWLGRELADGRGSHAARAAPPRRLRPGDRGRRADLVGPEGRQGAARGPARRPRGVRGRARPRALRPSRRPAPRRGRLRLPSASCRSSTTSCSPTRTARACWPTSTAAR